MTAIIAVGTSVPEFIATNEHVISLALECSKGNYAGTFLAPALVQAAIEGRLPRGIGIARLSDPTAEWSRQHQELGLPVP